MGINISGIAINRNYENDFEQLTKALGWKFTHKAWRDKFEVVKQQFKLQFYNKILKLLKEIVL